MSSTPGECIYYVFIFSLCARVGGTVRTPLSATDDHISGNRTEGHPSVRLVAYGCTILKICFIVHTRRRSNGVRWRVFFLVVEIERTWAQKRKIRTSYGFFRRQSNVLRFTHLLHFGLICHYCTRSTACSYIYRCTLLLCWKLIYILYPGQKNRTIAIIINRQLLLLTPVHTIDPW